MSIRSPDGALTSEFFCDPVSPRGLSLFSSNQAVDITKWNEAVSEIESSGSDFLFPSPDSEYCSDVFELKPDTASVCSMDSAYQSQTGVSRRGTATLSEGFRTVTPQDTRSRVSSQFTGSDLYSPVLGSSNFGTFPEQHSNMAQIQAPSIGGNVEPRINTHAFANYTSGQDYSHFTPTSIPQFESSNAINAEYPWPNPQSQTFPEAYAFDPFSKSLQPLGMPVYSQNDDVLFAPTAASQRATSRPTIDTTHQQSAIRTASFSLQARRRSSANDSGFPAYVLSPASATSSHLPNMAASDFERHHITGARSDHEETTSTSLAAQSMNDEDEALSPSDMVAAKAIEEEQGKAARSHRLYQQKPDATGKYHCPQEGKAGCTHKPTPLKCNYDKYVDSHLKPFRCNKKTCIGVQFSSTACLLRHEREAHGMHGHGSRPHLCHFAGCERAAIGNGFPRRYNLFDHMKRVHDYTGPTMEPSPPAPQGPGGNRKNTSRKRKSTADEPGEKRQKASKPSVQQQLQARRGELQVEFLSQKENIISILNSLAGPSDLDGDNTLVTQAMHLQAISEEYQKSLGG